MLGVLFGQSKLVFMLAVGLLVMAQVSTANQDEQQPEYSLATYLWDNPGYTKKAPVKKSEARLKSKSADKDQSEKTQNHSGVARCAPDSTSEHWLPYLRVALCQNSENQDLLNPSLRSESLIATYLWGDYRKRNVPEARQYEGTSAVEIWQVPQFNLDKKQPGKIHPPQTEQQAPEVNQTESPPPIHAAPGKSRWSEQYIVMGDDFMDVRQAVIGVRGDITHDLAIINSVGVALDQRQRTELERHPAISSILADPRLDTSAISYSVKGAPELSYQGNTVSWTISNAGEESLTIDNVSLSWPETNGRLLSVTLDSELIHGSIESGDVAVINELTAEPGIRKDKSAELLLSFDNDASVLSDDYIIRVGFAEGLVAEYGFHASSIMQGKKRDTFFPEIIAADQLHHQGLTGSGVGIAVIDTGAWQSKALQKNSNGDRRIVAYYDAIQNFTSVEMTDEMDTAAILPA